MTSNQHLNDFRAAMAEKGLAFKGPLVADAGLQRFDVDDDKPGSENGWYVLFTDGRTNGVYGCNKRYTGQKFYWKAGAETTSLTPAERAADRARIAAKDAHRAAKDAANHAAAATRASRVWDAAAEAPATHAYLARKRIGAHGTRVDGRGKLVVPVMIHGDIVSLQFIAPDGDKRFMPKGRTAGGCYEIGDVATAVEQWEIIVFCEGFATGASIAEATGWAVVICFNCGNLDQVVKWHRDRYPDGRFVIAADNDQWTKNNPGMTAARAVAKAYRCAVAEPVFADLDSRPTDFNDLHVLAGLEAVAAALREALEQPEPIPGPVEPDPAAAPLAPYWNEPSVPADEAARKLGEVLRDFFRRMGLFLDYKAALEAAVEQADIEAEEGADDALSIPGMKGMDASAGYFEICRITGVQPADDPSGEEIDGLRERVVEKLRGECRKHARARMRKDHRDINGNLPTPPRLQIKATAGLGKTSQVAALLRAKPEWFVHIYSPTHGLIDGTAEHLPDALRIRGRSQPAAPGGAEKMCARAEIAEEVTRAGVSVRENLCERGGKALQALR